MGATAKHRKQTPPPDRRRWWPLGLTVTVVGGIGTLIAAAPTVQDPAPVPTVPALSSAAALPYRDSVNTPESGDYLAALDKHGITIEPHTTVAVGHSLCSEKAAYNLSPATLAQQVRNDHPGITPMQAATIVEDAAKYLCNKN
jgi:hypothetical protein